jgi:hypothetical protein
MGVSNFILKGFRPKSNHWRFLLSIPWLALYYFEVRAQEENRGNF